MWRSHHETPSDIYPACAGAAAHRVSDLVLTCARVDGNLNTFHAPVTLVGNWFPGSNAFALDYGFADETIAHEYGHFLQWEINSWNDSIGRHSLCTEVDTFHTNDPEFAWAEGFADYFGAHMVWNNPTMSRIKGFSGSAPRSMEDPASAWPMSRRCGRFILVSIRSTETRTTTC